MEPSFEIPWPADHAALDRLTAGRHSCRGFLPVPVPRALQMKLLHIAQRTASWCNSQPWRVHITEGAGTKRFREAMLSPKTEDEVGPDFAWPAEYRGVYRQRRLDCALQLYDCVGIARGDREASAQQARENFRLFGAPHVAMVTTDAALGAYGAMDCGGYVANFLLAARSLGVASIAQAALASRPARVREFFGIGDDRLVVCGISFGYADESHAVNGFRTARASPEDVADWRST